MIPNRVNPLDIPENVLWNKASSIKHAGFYRETITAMIIENARRLLEVRTNQLIQNVFNQQMALHDRTEFVCCGRRD